MEEFAANKDIVKMIATEVGGVDVFREEYKRSEFFIYEKGQDYEDYNQLDAHPDDIDKTGFFEFNCTGLVVAKFFRWRLVCADDHDQITIYDGRNAREPLHVSVVTKEDFTAVDFHDENTLYMATDGKHCNLFLKKELVSDPELYSTEP